MSLFGSRCAASRDPLPCPPPEYRRRDSGVMKQLLGWAALISTALPCIAGCAKDAAPAAKAETDKSGGAVLTARPEVGWGDVENGIRLGLRYVGSAQDRVLLE